VALLVAANGIQILGGRPSAELLAEQLRFGTRALPGTLAERLQFRADSFLLNILIGVRATGIYSVTRGRAESLWYVHNAPAPRSSPGPGSAASSMARRSPMPASRSASSSPVWSPTASWPCCRGTSRAG